MDEMNIIELAKFPKRIIVGTVNDLLRKVVSSSDNW
jgi:hypothetical protein